jgi:6-pyruvoyltetrahydropterin/6-carboxytetrahydropterin synthase
MYEVVISQEFCAAHKLLNHKGVCADLHGHTWKVEVVVRAKNLKDGMVVDFMAVKSILDEILPDHSYLNEILADPTAENMAKWLYDELKARIPGVAKVLVWESSASGAAFFED